MFRAAIYVLPFLLLANSVEASSLPAQLPIQRTRLVALTVLPAEIVIDRPGAIQQLVVLGRRTDGSVEDLTARAQYRSASATIAPVDEVGTIQALRNGATRVTVIVPEAAGVSASVPVTVENAGAAYRWDYTRQIAPTLVRAGCSVTSCHGASAGKGGLKLSFFGHDPQQDYEALVRGAGGRRVNRLKPGASLMLLKPTMTLPHGGGLRFKSGSSEYRTLAQWIASGAPRGSDPTRVERLEVVPNERLLTRRGDTQRLLVTAHYSDGTREDVTRLALFECKNEAAVKLEGNHASFVGLGEAPVLVRFGGRMATANLTSSPLPPLRSFPAYSSSNPVDREVFGKLRRLRVPPAADASDSEILRRLYLDLTGRIPTAAEAQRFSNNKKFGKRETLIEELLYGPEFAKHWRDNLNALLMGRSAFPMAPAWSSWLETALKEDRGWDRITRELLLARPAKPEDNGALHFMDSRFAQGDTGLDVVTRDVSRIFFGVDIQCARCHTHPEVASWQQQAYWGIAAFFGRSYRIQVKGANYLAEKATGEIQYFGGDKNQRSALPVLLTGTALQEPPELAAGKESPELYLVAPEEVKDKTRVPVPKFSRRQRFVEAAISGEDPYFKRALVNWIWHRLMGRGLVEPIDQMHAGNPPSHPELLEELSSAFVRDRFSVRALIRSIVASQAYARSSEWKESVAALRERPPAELFAVAPVRPLSVQQLANSMLVAAGYGTETLDADPGKARAELEQKYADKVAEIRRKLDSGTETYQPNVTQALFLSNNRAFQQTLEQGGLGSRLAALKDDDDLVRQAYLHVLSRAPEPDEAFAFKEYLVKRADRRTTAVNQVLWALITSSEFRFIH